MGYRESWFSKLQTEKVKILESFLGRCYKSGEEHLFKCPRCRHSKNKLSINVNKGVYKCWICDYSGLKLEKLVRRYSDRTDYQRWLDLTNTVDIASFDSLFEQVEVKSIKSVELPESFQTLCTDYRYELKKPLRYLKSRGVSNEDILKWRVGFCSSGAYADRIIIPSFDDSGELNYFIARSYSGQYPKYKNPPVSKDFVFNGLMLDWESPVTLVEGAFDAIIADNSIPLLGSTLSERSRLFAHIVKNCKEVYLALDSDASYKELKIMKKLMEYGIMVYKIDTSGYEDVATMTKEVFQKKKDDALILTETNYLYTCMDF